MKRPILVLGFTVAVSIVGLVIVPIDRVSAEGSYVGTWQGIYPSSNSTNNAGSCKLCHTSSTDEFSPYGWKIRVGIKDQGKSLVDAIRALENNDSDSDPTGSTDLQEINANAQPGWTEGANNTIYQKNGTTLTNQLPPSGISGSLDPAAANNPPVANNQTVTTSGDTPVGITLAASDSDGNSLTYSIVSGPSNGSLSGTAPNVTYTPSTGYSGPDSFTFKANDGTADSNIATVSINVDPAQTDPGILTFAEGVFSAVESQGTVAIGVSRSNGTGGEVSVTYGSADNSATTGEDYMAAAGILTWANGEGGTKTFEITIIDDTGDSHYEGVEKVILTLSNPSAGATLGDPSEAALEIEDEEDLAYKLYFPQFVNGDGFFSKVTLLNPGTGRSVYARLIVRRANGELFPVDLNGVPTPGGSLETEVLPSAVNSFQTSPTGAVETGSVIISSDAPLSGVIVFGGLFGLAGVQSSSEFSNGFVGPAETLGSEVRTGVAVQNLEDQEVTVSVELVDADGTELASASFTVPGMGQIARFVDELEWDDVVDFSSFEGSIRVVTQARLAAVMIQNQRVNGMSQFATVPVAAP